MKFIKKTKKSTIRYRNKSKKQNGGKPPPPTFIAQGSSGCVYLPSLSCKPNECNPSSDPRCKYQDDTISKLMTKDLAADEKKNDDLLLSVGYDTSFNYHLRPPISCPLEKSSLSPTERSKCSLTGVNHLLLYENGGHDFFYTLYESDTLEDLDPSFILGEDGLINILKGIIELNTKNLLHRDLNDANTVVGRNTSTSRKKMKMIDFGLLTIINQNEHIGTSETSTNADENTDVDILFGENAYGNKDHGDTNFFENVREHHPISCFFLGYNVSNIPNEQRSEWEKK
jgi:hypothetical protein